MFNEHYFHILVCLGTRKCSLKHLEASAFDEKYYRHLFMTHLLIVYSKFSSNSEASASELLENPE